MLHLRTGAIRDAQADARTAIEIGREPALHSCRSDSASCSKRCAERGELEAAEAVLADTGSGGELPDRFLVDWALQGRGSCASHRVARRGRRRPRGGRSPGREGWRPWNPAMFPYRSALATRPAASPAITDRARALADEERRARAAMGRAARDRRRAAQRAAS